MYNITFQQLATFFAVAERLNVSETANALYISQSAISKAIRRLEEGLGVRLFVRSNRGVSLTREGEFLFSRLRQSYDGMCRTIEQARAMQSGPQKVVRIGYPSTYDASEDYDRLKQLIAEYSAEHPEVELNEMLYDFMELKQALAFGEVDIAFAHNFILGGMKNISMKKVCRSRMCLAMSAKHPLASAGGLDEIDFKELEKEYFYTILFEDEPTGKRATAEMLARYGIAPRDIRFVKNFQTLMRVVRQGKGMCICGYFPKATGHEEMRFFIFPPRPDDPYLAAAWRPGEISEEALDFLGAIPDDPERLTVVSRKP